MESIGGTLKTDNGLDESIPVRHRHAELAVLDYIETFHNPARRQSSLGRICAAAYENKRLPTDVKAV
jgi:hypothetical protein